MTYAVFVKNCFCPDNNWQVYFIGTDKECRQVRDGNNQGVRVVIQELRDLHLWDIVKGGRFAPITFPDYSPVARNA